MPVLESAIAEGATTITSRHRGYAVRSCTAVLRISARACPILTGVWSVHCTTISAWQLQFSGRVGSAVRASGMHDQRLGERAGNCSWRSRDAVRTRRDFFDRGWNRTTQIVRLRNWWLQSPASQCSRTRRWWCQRLRTRVGDSPGRRAEARDTYEIMRAEDVAGREQDRARQTGPPNAFKQRVNELAIPSRANGAERGFCRVQGLADRKSEIFDEDISRCSRTSRHAARRTLQADSMMQKSETANGARANRVYSGREEVSRRIRRQRPGRRFSKAIESRATADVNCCSIQ